MPVINVACPYCGGQTGATIPRNANLDQVTTDKLKSGGFKTMATAGLLSSKDPSNYTEAAYPDEHQFYVYYE